MLEEVEKRILELEKLLDAEKQQTRPDTGKIAIIESNIESNKSVLKYLKKLS